MSKTNIIANSVTQNENIIPLKNTTKTPQLASKEIRASKSSLVLNYIFILCIHEYKITTFGQRSFVVILKLQYLKTPR